jgi:hypothetical protein
MSMRIRASFLTVAMVAVLAVSASRRICATELSRSATAFCQYFHALREEPLNPVERFVFSLVLANTEAPHDNGKPARRGA